MESFYRQRTRVFQDSESTSKRVSPRQVSAIINDFASQQPKEAGMQANKWSGARCLSSFLLKPSQPFLTLSFL